LLLGGELFYLPVYIQRIEDCRIEDGWIALQDLKIIGILP